MSFSDKVIVITGGASGIGLKTARLMANHGGTVIITDIQDEVGKQKAEELDLQCRIAFGLESQKSSVLSSKSTKHVRFIQVDVSNIDDIRRLVDDIISEFSRIDILVNCAGIGSLSQIPEITPQEWDKVLNINLRSVFFCSQEVLKYMCTRRTGKIINIASAAGKIGGVAVGAHYSASKAAVICLTKSLALYGAPYNINVNCVCPGPTKTQLTDSWGEELNREFAAKIPLKRYGTAEEISYAISFLASDEANYITGEILDVNGGLVMD